MAHNEDSDFDDDDDKHVLHSWQPNNPSQMPLSLLINEVHHNQST
jgi:hypothetical protein